MKKIYLTLVLLATCTASILAQTERRLTKIMLNSTGGTQTFEYNKEGKMSKITSNSPDGIYVNTFSYQTDKIIQTYTENGGRADSLIAVLENGRIVRQTLKLIGELGNVTYTNDYNITYDTAGQLTEVIEHKQNGETIRHEVVWENGNITRVKQHRGNTLVGETVYTYDNETGNNDLNGLLSPLISTLSDEGVMPTAQIAEGYFGKRIKNNILLVKYIAHVPNSYGWNSEDNMEIDYYRDFDEKITEVAISGNEPDILEVEWSDITTDISNNAAVSTQKEIYYDINGISTKQLKKGVNIIKSEDKRTRKVLVK
ncbi:MAG: DUF4595 domain-containing protein [Prevotella sp.]|nr:DUF4595 domain-containing protein [Prevotella sp.]